MKRVGIRFSSFITYPKKMNDKKRGKPSYMLEVMWNGLLDYRKKSEMCRITQGRLNIPSQMDLTLGTIGIRGSSSIAKDIK